VETHLQFHERLKVIFNKWIHMAKIPVTFNALKEAIIREHVIKTYRKELVIFLAEREYETLDQLAQAADRFEEAHSRVGAPERKDQPHTSERSKTSGWRGNNNGRTGMDKQDPPDARKTTGRDINEAPSRQIVCFTCNKPGHISRNCEQRTKPLMIGSVAVTDQTGDRGDSTSVSVNGKTTNLLLDSGCEIPFIVHARLVRKRFYTGKKVQVRYLNGHVETLPQVSIVIDTPYVKGRVMAVVSKGMTQGLTLGGRYVEATPRMDCPTSRVESTIKTTGKAKPVESGDISENTVAGVSVIKTSVATTDDGMMHTSGHASCIGVKVVGARDGDHPTSKRTSNQVACATTDPWNRVVGGAELGEQLCQEDSNVHGCSCSGQENVLKELIGRISEFLNVAADLIQRGSVAVPAKNQLDVDESHIASGFGPEHGYRL